MNMNVNGTVESEDYVTSEDIVETPSNPDSEFEIPTQPEENPLSDREYKMAYLRAMRERKEKIKQNKEMVADMELEVAYRKAQSDLLKYRFEHMDYYLKNLDVEPRYLVAMEEQKAKQTQTDTSNTNLILD